MNISLTMTIIAINIHMVLAVEIRAYLRWVLCSELWAWRSQAVTTLPPTRWSERGNIYFSYNTWSITNAVTLLRFQNYYCYFHWHCLRSDDRGVRNLLYWTIVAAAPSVQSLAWYRIYRTLARSHPEIHWAWPLTLLDVLSQHLLRNFLKKKWTYSKKNIKYKY